MVFESEDDINTLLQKAAELVRENITEYFQYEISNNRHDQRNSENIANITDDNRIENADRNKRQEGSSSSITSNVGVMNRNPVGNINSPDVILIDSSPATTPTIPRVRQTEITRHPFVRRRNNGRSGSEAQGPIVVSASSSHQNLVTPISRTGRRGRRNRFQSRNETLSNPGLVINLDDYEESSSAITTNTVREVTETNRNENLELSTPAENQSEGKLSIKCAVCLDSIRAGNAASTICGHVFCKTCIIRTFQLTKKCPLCNRKLMKNSIHPLYLE